MHGALHSSAASYLLLWLEQEPTAADFLAQHFPLSTIIEEADYNTLHKIIIGLCTSSPVPLSHNTHKHLSHPLALRCKKTRHL